MSDLNLTAAIRSNLLALQTTNKFADRTSNRLSTGLKVSSAVDDAVAYFAAKALNDRADTFEGRKQGIDQAISTLNVAVQATSTIDTILKQMKGLLQSAQSNTSNASQLAQLSTQFNDLAVQINSVVKDATYQGTNLVGNGSVNSAGTQSVTLAVNFSDLSTSKVDVYGQFLGSYADITGSNAGLSQYTAASTIFSTISGYGFLSTGSVNASAGTAGSALIGLLTGNGLAAATDISSQSATNVYVISSGVANATASDAGGAFVGFSNLTNAGFTAAINSIDLAISKNRGAAAVYGSTIALLTTRLDFTKQYVDTLQGGAGKYTLADLNQEGANLVALQTRQQLGIQSLSFSGQITQSILRLFQ